MYKRQELFYACSPFEPTGSAREYGLCRRMPDGSIQPVALPVWKWEVFYLSLIHIFLYAQPIADVISVVITVFMALHLHRELSMAEKQVRSNSGM